MGPVSSVVVLMGGVSTMANSYTERNKQSLAELRDFVGMLTDDQLQQDLGDGWTVAAVLGHLAFWDRRAFQNATRVSANDSFRNPGENVDVLNDALLYQWKRIPPRDAISEFIEAGTQANEKMDSADQATVEHWLELRTFAVDRAE